MKIFLTVSTAVLATALAACSGGGSGDAGSTAITSCADPALEVYFSPMYSAYEPTHQYQIPAIVGSISTSALQWYASDPTKVDLTPDPSLGGVMITTKASGTVNILPEAGGLCGSSLLTITQNTPEDWDAGFARYNLAPMPDSGFLGNIYEPDGGSAYIACSYCHGATADGPFKDIAHTPEQAGGFSDQQLAKIFTQGEVPGWTCYPDAGGFGGHSEGWAASSPDAGYFDTLIVSYCEWNSFHHWPMQSQEQITGVICYLRSLTPTPQNGSADFGGHGPGGHPTGGYGGTGGLGGTNGGSGGTTG